MPEITANIVVQPISLSVSQDNPSVEVTVDSTNLNLYTATAPSILGGNVGQLQYRATGNILGGIANSNVDANGNLVFTNLSNVKIEGGVNGYYIQTDGAGNLTWGVGANFSGNGVPGGANTEIQYNDGTGNFAGDSSFTFDNTTDTVTVANLTITGTVSGIDSANFANFAGEVTNSAQPNITSLGTLSALTVAGTTSIYEAIENVNLIGAQTGTYDFDLLDGSIQYSTANTTGNLILNFRGNSTISANTMLANGKSITSTYILTTGSTPYEITGIQIDGANANIKWAGGTVPTVFTNAHTAFTYTIIKTSTSPTYDIFASATRYL